MSETRILNLVHRLWCADEEHKAAMAAWDADGHRPQLQAAVSEAGRVQQAALRTLLEAEGARQARLRRGGVA